MEPPTTTDPLSVALAELHAALASHRDNERATCRDVSVGFAPDPQAPHAPYLATIRFGTVTNPAAVYPGRGASGLAALRAALEVAREASRELLACGQTNMAAIADARAAVDRLAPTAPRERHG
jgi:hypothetical protein